MSRNENKHYTDMTVGPIAPILLRFALPLMVGGLFQNLYNLADMTIAGHILGDSALASISAVNALMTLMTQTAIGFNVGNAILVSNAFGEGDLNKARINVTSMTQLCVLVTLFISSAFVLFLKPLMRLVNTPEDLFEGAYVYILTISLGLIANMAYNLYACAFRAFGNSKMPLYFLIFSSMMNIVLDLLFIAVFHWGVFGAAFATVLSQALAAGLSGTMFYRMFPEMHPQKGDFKAGMTVWKKMFGIGAAAALTNSVFSIGMVAIQGAANSLGESTIIAKGAASKIRMFAVLPSVNLANTIASFAAQNYGAKKYDRITKGTWTAVGLSAMINVVTYTIAFFLAGTMVRLITGTENPEVIRQSEIMLRIELAFIWAQTAIMSFRFSIQGLNYKVIPIIATVIELCTRCICAFWLVKPLGFIAIPIAEPFSWLVCGSAMCAAYYVLIGKVKARDAAALN